ncbi:MAG: hypothetical protein PHV13_01150 [Candidatus ainarchaeum sp.]|nr:hypothetical protein [Candidatus ainarchaeum sp.]
MRPRHALLFLAILAIAGCTQQSAGRVDAVDCRLDDPQYDNGIGMDTTLLAGLQDELLWCIENNRTFDNGRALALLDSFWPENPTGIREVDRMNPLLWNNLAIRSGLIRMMVMQQNDPSYAPDFGPVLEKIRQYGFESGGYATWYEGSGYLVYTLAAVRQANLHFYSPELRDFEASSVRWLNDFALPDGTLAPIGDTALGSAYAPENRQDRVAHTDHETAITFDNGTGYLLFRHPVANLAPASPIRNDLHTQFDFGSVWLWYNGSWRIRPIGYPGYPLKIAENLDDKLSYNIQSAGRIGEDFTQADFNSLDFMRYSNSWRAKTSATLPGGPVLVQEYPDRYELAFSYALNTGEGGIYENYSRKITLYKGQKRLDITDSNPVALSSSLLVSGDAIVSSAFPVSCSYGAKWSPAWGTVEESRRCSAGPGQALSYAVEWQ